MKRNQKTFSESVTDEVMEFEKNIAYFYGAKSCETIAKFYLAAIRQLETIGIHADNDRLEQAMLTPLKQSYAEVINQTQLKFDIDKAAHYELQLILAQAKMAPFEELCEIMTNLYKEVFNANENEVHKGAMLRTFLYKYKISLLKKDISLSNDDRALMIAIAKASEKELNSKKKDK